MSPRRLPKDARFRVSGEHGCLVDPELARLAVRYISAWSRIELARTHAITRMMDADHVAVGELLESIRGVGRDRAMAAVAELALSQDDFGLYRKVDSFLEPIRKLRNRMAHYIWAASPDAPDSILLINPRDLTRKAAKDVARSKDAINLIVEELVEGGSPTGPVQRMHLGLDPKIVEVYTREQIEEALGRVGFAHAAVYLIEWLAQGGALAARARDILPQVLSSPHSPPPATT